MAKRTKGQGAGQTIGSILAGFDQQVFRTTPPPHELVQKGDRLPAVPAEDGGTMTIELPDPPARSAEDSGGRPGSAPFGEHLEGARQLSVDDRGDPIG